MWYKKDVSGNICEICSLPVDDSYLYSEDEIVFNYAGKLIFKSETQTEEYKDAEAAFIENQNKEAIRTMRTNECFSVINRGKPWYDKLSSEQITELEGWYQNWLDAPQTGTIPDRPTWLK